MDIVVWWSTRISSARTAKFRTTCLTLIFNVLTCIWYVTHRSLIGCICATYEHNPWNRQWATERTWHAGGTDKRSETNIYPTALLYGGMKNINTENDAAKEEGHKCYYIYIYDWRHWISYLIMTSVPRWQWSCKTNSEVKININQNLNWMFVEVFFITFRTGIHPESHL